MAVLLRGLNLVILALMVWAVAVTGCNTVFGFPCSEVERDYLQLPVTHENRRFFMDQLARCRGTRAERARALEILRMTTDRT